MERQKMMEIFIFGILYGMFGVSFSETLRNRVDFLELEVSRQSFRTRSDIIELRKLITSVTGSVAGNDTVDNRAVETKLNSLDEKLEHFTQEQHDRTTALAMAITEEKAMTRQMLKIIQDLADSNTESVLEMENILRQSEVEREIFKREWKLFEDGVKSDLNEMDTNTKLLQDKLENLNGNVIIKKFEKKDPCPKNWFQDNDTCYLYQTSEKLSWYGARIRCDDLGGKLAEPDTEETMMYILLTVHDNNVWIGGTDDGHESSWVWASSQKSISSKLLWQHSQPNNLYGNQHCLEIGLSSMNDESCLEENYYICEKAVAE